MSHQQLITDQIDICFHAHESMIQRIKQWPCVFVIVVSVGMGERSRRLPRPGDDPRKA